jgi:hypothetical protein
MLGTILKMVAYSKAPKATFAVLHPRAAAQLGHARWDIKHGWAPRASAIGAALIALPIGYMLAKLTQPRPRVRPALAEPPMLDAYDVESEPRDTELL